MWLYFKAVKESIKKFKEDYPNKYWTAEFGFGYAVTKYPLFLLETFLEACLGVFLIMFFHTQK